MLPASGYHCTLVEGRPRVAGTYAAAASLRGMPPLGMKAGSAPCRAKNSRCSRVPRKRHTHQSCCMLENPHHM